MAGTLSTSGRVAATGSCRCPQFALPGRQANFAAVLRRLQAKHAQRRGAAMPAAAVVAVPETPLPTTAPAQRPDAAGRYGRFGGKYVPETLIAALADLEVAYREAQNDPDFQVRRCSCSHGELQLDTLLAG